MKNNLNNFVSLFPFYSLYRHFLIFCTLIHALVLSSFIVCNVFNWYVTLFTLPNKLFCSLPIYPYPPTFISLTQTYPHPLYHPHTHTYLLPTHSHSHFPPHAYTCTHTLPPSPSIPIPQMSCCVQPFPTISGTLYNSYKLLY